MIYPGWNKCLDHLQFLGEPEKPHILHCELLVVQDEFPLVSASSQKPIDIYNDEKLF
jgi:hypothetical protein